MPRQAFTLVDLAQECAVETGCHALHGWQAARLGIRIHVPQALQSRYPYNASAYVFLQQLRAAIAEYGTVEFPGLPLNRCNHTIAMRAPQEHRYSSNPYLTGECQHLHQDTPPYPTAFWLGAERRYYATWIVSLPGLQRYAHFTREHPGLAMNEVHRQLVPESIANGTGIVCNHSAGLILIDNSEQQQLYHARTARFDHIAQDGGAASDTPMYAFNETGLLHYIDTMDERRGPQDRDAQDKADVIAFLQQEG